MLNQYAVDNPTLPVNQRFFPFLQNLAGMLSRSLGMLCRNDGPPCIWDTMVYRETFLQIQRRLLQHLIRKSQILGSLMYQNTHHHMWWVKAKHQLSIRDASQDRQPAIHSSPVREDFQIIMVQTNNDWRFRILFLTNSLRQQRSLVGRWDSKTEVCTCSQFPTEAMLWIKEVEMVETVDDLKSSCSVSGIRTPDFEVLDAKIASGLNKIIRNSHFKWRGSLEEQKAQKEDRFLCGRQIAYLIYNHFRVTGANDSVENYADLFTTVLRNDDISGIRFETWWNSFINDENPIGWHLGRIVQIKNTKVWETQDRIGIVQYGDSSEDSWTWLSQIEDNGEKEYRAESTN